MIDLNKSVEQLTGFKVDCSKLEAELVTLRNYSQTDVLWMLVHMAAQTLSAEYSSFARDNSFSAPKLETFRQLVSLQARVEATMQKRVDAVVESLPAVPVRTLSDKLAGLPMKDSLVPTGYYLKSCSTNKRPVTVKVGKAEPTVIPPGGQVTVQQADVCSVSASGDGQIVRWVRMASPEPKQRGEKVFPLPTVPKPRSHARDFAIAALVMLAVIGALVACQLLNFGSV